MSNPFELLELDRKSSKAQVKERWRKLAAVHHPDKGGDSATFQTLKKAYEEALLLASDFEYCPKCEGKRTIEIRRGFTSIKLPCPECSIK